MKKNILSIVLLFIVVVASAQKSQRIAYIDMEYILQNVPEYVEAQNSLNAKVEKWKTKLDKEARHIEVLKTDLANEKAILTKDLIEEREEDIAIKQESLRRLESLYFGPQGDMYILRRKLVQPVQDQVYNAIQNIATKKKYDFVFDKSSDLVMLYSNKKYDISELIIKLINIDQKKQAKKDKIEAKRKLLSNNDISEEQKAKKEKKEAKRKQRIKEKEERIKRIEEKRKALLKAREDKRKLLKEKREALKKAQEEAKNKKNTK
ncbi:OmpH family outer membrane protein [Tenacibaculum maritimum]|uniref:OmpH family outer membrane protein n=1 Tax=Tenacibaculum maritimum TaxID=107401 RepID=UPI0010A5070A|nr:OmpH family outer membrane protein [Tenacibaculum maritimum]MCD9562528.1 OmpH family outer membrane protein [Tenacibaculum maritimum]MCD9564907.1 OmpH family outer membrane protein [Tenacibaculum maritimum]MCD9577686.1 OmpH family outer membrane protein [Tenacibaculum maritimum]MCD9583708.1 OmpH family outer membrane protein [Tenacibaculum maritimum]MCD9595652.1 OmpH family outer membrane protein [Tenacibaculum maritimum]